MNKSITLFFILLPAYIFPQNILTIKDVRLEQRGDKVDIKFYFKAPSSQYILRIAPQDVALEKRSGKRVFASAGAVSGDVDTWLKPNEYYSFQWFLKDDIEALDGEYKAVIDGQLAYLKGGPSNAFYSLFLAGLGRYKLDTRNKYPAFLSITSGFLVGGGIALQSVAFAQYSKYQTSNDQEEIDRLFKNAQNLSRISYFLLVPGVTINVVDFFAVLSKGMKNAKFNRTYD